MKKYTVPILFFIALTISYFCFTNHEAHSFEKINFYIEKPYLSVVKNMSQKNSLEKIVEQNEGKVIYKKWENFDLEVPDRILRIRQYKVEGTLNFTVEKNDKDLGKMQLNFIQKLYVDFKNFSSTTHLSKSQNQIPFYEKIIKMNPEDNKTKVEITSEIKIKKNIPFFFNRIMDEKVEEFNKKDIKKLKENIINISEKNE